MIIIHRVTETKQSVHEKSANVQSVVTGIIVGTILYRVFVAKAIIELSEVRQKSGCSTPCWTQFNNYCNNNVISTVWPKNWHNFCMP